MSYRGNDRGTPDGTHGSQGVPAYNEESLVRDEVCGMRLSHTAALVRTEFQGRTYYFCAERCRSRFLEHPAWYVPVRPESRA